MGSKKLKKKKVKVKKLEKTLKSKLCKRKKKCNSGLFKKVNSVEDIIGINNFDDRFSSPSRSYFEEDYVSSINYFSKVREDCFSSLQSVISDNCVFYVSPLSKEMLQKIALELEQSALLACLQVEIYQKTMLQIIKNIKRSTEQKKIHDKVKLLLPDDTSQETAMEIISTTPPASLTEIETGSKIPSIINMRVNNNETVKDFWTESEYNSEQYYSVTDFCQDQNRSILDFDTNSRQEEKNFTSELQSNMWSQSIQQMSDSDINRSQNDSITQNNASDVRYINAECKQSCSSEKNNKISDPLLESRNQLQKLVEQTLNETEKAKKEKRDKRERDYIVQILEGEDLDNRLNDSLSDNESNLKENVDDLNFIERLDKMRELFGFEENSSDLNVEKPKPKKTVHHLHSNKQRTFWKYEKYIHLYKYSTIASEMTFDKRKLSQKLFRELFGEDSDEEHELEYSCEKRYRSNCTERISFWIVKYLMPYYHDKRIFGRKMFKNLGHHIAEAIIDEIQYPDEWTVKYYVSKFFPPKQKYFSTEDILNFQLE